MIKKNSHRLTSQNAQPEISFRLVDCKESAHESRGRKEVGFAQSPTQQVDMIDQMNHLFMLYLAVKAQKSRIGKSAESH